MLTQPNLHVLEIGAGSAGAMHTFLASASGRESGGDGSVASFDPGGSTRRHAVVARRRRQRAAASVSRSIARRGRRVRSDRASARRGAALDEMLRVVRRPGHIIIGLPNHASLWTPLEDRPAPPRSARVRRRTRPRRVAMVEEKCGTRVAKAILSARGISVSRADSARGRGRRCRCRLLRGAD